MKFLIIAATLALLFGGVRLAKASTNVTSTPCCHWAWNDAIGWIDFYNTQTVSITSQNLTGYASSSAGDISLDCHTTRNGNICKPDWGGTGSSDYQVTNDGNGYLSGWAWNDNYGWISFDCHNNNGCATSQYQVQVDPNTGNFDSTDGYIPKDDYAWNDVIGWISFNCDNNNGCSQSDYYVNTSWTTNATSGVLDSATFDTGIAQGAQFNSIMWQGSLPSSTTSVKLQLAVSNSSSGPWTFVGSDGTANSYYTPNGPGASLLLGYTFHNNYRYFRYRASLFSDPAQKLSPRVDDVIVNWSP